MEQDDFNFRPIQDEELFSHGHRVQGKVVLITGAATGIGREAAAKFAAHGAKVVIGDRNVEGAQETVSQIVRAGGTAVCTSCNVTVYDEVASLYEFAIKEHGSVDIVVANAGVTEAGEFHSITLDAQGRPKKPRLTTIDVNLMGSLYSERKKALFSCSVLTEPEAVYLAQHYLLLGDSKGLKSIVLLGSISSWKAIPLGPLYTASKHAVLGMMRSTHPLLAAKGIRIAVVHPFFVDTPILGAPVKLFLAGLPLTPVSRVAGTIFYSATDPDPTTDGSAWLLLNDGPVVVVPKEDFKFGIYKALDRRVNGIQRGMEGAAFYIRLVKDIARILKLKRLLAFALLVGLASVVWKFSTQN
ncbi:NAD(P)-binding protein [Hymenopellis radicata]|nr:NAD(P)-binding protein [Hymenopellis radicata]